jgi:pimeloyl-ACP methyl ester carboxylesterase
MSEIGHEAIDRWIALRRLLRFAPARIPTRLAAQIGSPLAGWIASAFAPLVRDWLWHPDNLDLEVVRFMMRHGVEDLPRSLLVEFARWYEARRMSDRYQLFSFGDHLERIRAPILVIAGGRDRLTPPVDLERVVAGVGAADKTFWVAGHASGLAHEYSHVDLVLGRHAPDDIYPVVTQWLDEHKPAKPA